MTVYFEWPAMWHSLFWTRVIWCIDIQIYIAVVVNHYRWNNIKLRCERTRISALCPAALPHAWHVVDIYFLYSKNWNKVMQKAIDNHHFCLLATATWKLIMSVYVRMVNSSHCSSFPFIKTIDSICTIQDTWLWWFELIKLFRKLILMLVK